MAEHLTLEVPGHRLVLDVAGDGRALSWQVDDHELLGAKSTDLVEYGMYAMGPWAGRLAENRVSVGDRLVDLPPTHAQWALHGTTLGRQCVVVEHRTDGAQATAIVEVDLGPTWPWPGVLRAHWRLQRDRLQTRLELIAHAESFPGVVGWHPWFRRIIDGSAAQWEIDGAQLAERDDEYRLTGRLLDVTAPAGSFDDAFRGGSGKASITWPGVLAIDVVSSHRWFVVFDREAGLVCLEPQSGPPNGVNNGLGDVIEWALPDQPIVLDTEWRIRREPPQH